MNVRPWVSYRIYSSGGKSCLINYIFKQWALSCCCFHYRKVESCLIREFPGSAWRSWCRLSAIVQRVFADRVLDGRHETKAALRIIENQKQQTFDIFFRRHFQIHFVICLDVYYIKGGISLISKSTQPLKCRRHLHLFLYSLFNLCIAFQRKETCRITRIRPWFFFLFRSRFHPWVFFFLSFRQNICFFSFSDLIHSPDVFLNATAMKQT